MLFNTHSRFAGQHAVLSASSYHWLNYDDERMLARLRTKEAAARGTRLHALAHDLIREGVRLPKSDKTLNMYVNDAIGYMMTPEQMLFVSENCFGTADAISYRKGKLRIHDLKTGVTEAHIEQLVVYAAMFCIEYGVKPYEIEIELRIYQNNERLIFEPDPQDVVNVMDKIRRFDQLITKARQEELA